MGVCARAYGCVCVCVHVRVRVRVCVSEVFYNFDVSCACFSVIHALTCDFMLVSVLYTCISMYMYCIYSVHCSTVSLSTILCVIHPLLQYHLQKRWAEALQTEDRV